MDSSHPLWAEIEPLIQAAITERLIAFHSAMVSRGQIPKPAPQDQSVDADYQSETEHSGADCTERLGHALQRVESLRRTN
jgi:hypothetical protein